MTQCTQFTHGRPTTPDPTSPTLQECKEESEEKEEEKEPLLSERKESFILSTSSIRQKVKFLSLRNPLKWNWRNIVMYMTLWSAYLSVNASYSVIAPFFPKEVSSVFKLCNNFIFLIYNFIGCNERCQFCYYWSHYQWCCSVCCHLLPNLWILCKTKMILCVAII